MYTPQVDVSNMFNGDRSMFIPPFLFDKPPRFSFDTSGVLGLLGGDDAVSAMTAVHVYGNRRWLGWYNTPGSFQIAKRLHAFTKSATLSSIFSTQKPLSKNVHTDPMALFDLDSYKGPKFQAAHSGTVIEETSYLAALFMKECAAWNADGKVVPGRKTQPIRITIVDLGQAPASEMRPASRSASTLLLACVPIATSVGTCVVSALFEDWYASALILLGIVASGVSCFVLGSGDLVFTHPEPAKGSPAGDGILGSDKEFVLLKGTEGAVNSITRGDFSLRFSSGDHHVLVRCCSLLFSVQCIAQLLLIPQASLFGQLMFLGSLCVSALYNARLASLDKEQLHRKLLVEKVLECPPLTKYTLGTRTTAVVFMLLVLQPHDPGRLLDALLPNDTRVWTRWKETILARLRHTDDRSFHLPDSLVGHADMDGFTSQEKELLTLLYADARAAYNGYRDYLRIDAL